MPATTEKAPEFKSIPVGWYPVNSFPKDGKWYLVSGMLYEVMVVHWNKDRRQVQDVMGYLFDMRHFKFWTTIKEIPKYDFTPVRRSEY